MTVYLKGGGLLTEYLAPDVDPYTRRVDAAEGQTLRQIVESIGLPPGHVAMAFVEGRLVNLAYTPREGDVIVLRPPVQGG